MESRWKDKQRESSSSNRIMDSRIAIETYGTFHRGSPALKYSTSRILSLDLDHVPVMVRIKQRYLLVHILYPYPTDPAAKNSSKSQENALPELVQFHRPSPDDLTPQLLVRTIRDQVLLLYGDYGLGLVSSSLISRFHASQIHGLLVKS